MSHVLLGNPDGVDLDSHAHSVSSGRRVPTPCTCRRSPLRRSSFHPGKEFYPADFPPSPDISHSEFCPLTFHIRNSVRRHFTSSGYLTAGWERRKFQLPRSDISRSSNSAYPESIRGRQFRLPGFCTMLQCSPEASRYLPPTKIFSLKIFCVNFYFLLVISQRYYWDIS